MRSHEENPSSAPPVLELWGCGSQHCCPPQSKLWRGQSIPVPHDLHHLSRPPTPEVWRLWCIIGLVQYSYTVTRLDEVCITRLPLWPRC